jgi:hypothetical protein
LGVVALTVGVGQVLNRSCIVESLLSRRSNWALRVGSDVPVNSGRLEADDISKR